MATSQNLQRLLRPGVSFAAGIVTASLLATVILYVSPALRHRLADWVSADVPGSTPQTSHDIDHHDHSHPGHVETMSIELTEQARRNIGLAVGTVELGEFDRTISMPAMVVDRPGWTQIDVVAPMTGIITRIYALEGEAVESGKPLFEIRLTHEELVQAQADLLRTAEELDVLKREIARLEEVAAGGAVAGRRVLEQQYEHQKLEAALKAHRQSLLLHGLSGDQVDQILADRRLLSTLEVAAPDAPADTDDSTAGHVLYVQQLSVGVGQHVNVGDLVCRLADHTELYVEGKAFEQDAASINVAAENKWPVTAVFETGVSGPDTVAGLNILYVSNVVEPETRALHVYVRLPNEVVREETTQDGHRFLSWRYRPGQRLNLRIPVERLTDRIVLPVDAIAHEGAETYVFQLNGEHFDRRAVHVEYRDQKSAVIANDGSLFPGDRVAMSGAHQMQLALKNKASGAPDPHAGHNH